MEGLRWNMDDSISSCPGHVRHEAVAMAAAVAEQRHIEYSAIMGVWRPNAWTNFDEIWYTRADNYLNDSLVIKY